MKVKNLNGSSRFPLPRACKSWISYWEMNKNPLSLSVIYLCPACRRKLSCNDLDGAHVIKVDAADKNVYIVPLCRSCNQRADSFEVDESLLLPVPSNLNV